MPVVGVGLGMGPLDRKATARLRRLGRPFDHLAVRDAESQRLAHEDLGWEAERCLDFIDHTFLRSVLHPGNHGTARLGVALRAWPGLEPEQVASLIDTATATRDVHDIVFFVLESNGGRGIDVDFAESVRTRLSTTIPSTVEVYADGNPLEFARAMSRVDHAISMKLHSSAIWDAAGVTMQPIVYAPKIASFFGVPYRGLEILPADSRARPEPTTIPRAATVIARQLPALIEGGRSERGLLTRRDRLSGQVGSFRVDLGRKLRRVVR